MIPIWQGISRLDQNRNLSRKQERVEGQNLNDSYLARNIKTRPESESFKEARKCGGTESD